MHNFADKQKIFLDIVLLLSEIIDPDDDKSIAHGMRVATFSQAIAKQLDHGNPSQLYIAGLLHDIGGVGLQDHILYYALNDFNHIEAQSHPTKGAEILRSFPPFHPLAGWVADHHERFDGTGFPDGKSTYDITSEAGILHLADQLDIFLRKDQEATFKEIRLFLNQQSAGSVAPIIVEGAKQLFSSQEKSTRLQESCSEKHFDPGTDIYFQAINTLSIPELICQLLWLTAQMTDSKVKQGGFHSTRVAFYCHRIAKAFHSANIDPIQALWAGLTHDIGLHSPPEQELNRDTGVLATPSPDYQQHPQYTADFISSIQILKHLAPIAAAHHELWDGTGFPNGLKGDKIPLLSQIITLCEYYEILTEGDHECHHFAINELEKKRNQFFSPQLLDVALPVLDTWGPRDISWIHDIKNVYTFFTSDPFDTIPQEQHVPVQTQEPEDKDSYSTPRQWKHTELTTDFRFSSDCSNLKVLAGLTDTEPVTSFFDIIDSSKIETTLHKLKTLENTFSLTLTLSSRYKTPLELIFLKQNNCYKLLYRGVNKKPLFTRKHSIFYQHFKNTPEAELILDKETVITDVNSSALLLLGFPRQGLVGKDIESYFSPFLSKNQLSSLHMFLVVEDETIWIEEFSLINHKGTPFAVQATIIPLPKISDQELTYLCRIRDISLRKELEMEMAKRDKAMQLIVHNISGMTGEGFFRALLLQFAAFSKSTQVMIGELTAEGTVIQPIAFREGNYFYTKKAFRLENTPAQMVIQKGELFLSDNVQERFPLDPFLQRHNAKAYWGLPLRSQDGTLVGILNAMDTKRIDHSKNTQALLKVLQSLAGSELARMQATRVLKEKEKQLESQNLELTRMNQLKSDMIAVTSHDLKSPLSAIIGYANLLEQYFSSLEEEKKIYYIQRIEAEGLKQLDFINKLLDLYRIESGTIDLELIPERLDFLLEECVGRQQHVAAERNIRIELSVEGTPEISIFDPFRMEQVISNILSNAIKFSPADKQINVRFHQDKHSLTVKVCDHGKGIDEEEILHIFDRYYMGRTNFDIRPEGSGLGLYIVKNIISLHGGDVSARNRKNGGSCFTVQIPVTPDK